MHLVARCVLNTPEHFPYKTKKDGSTKKQREYFMDDPSYTGKKVDYLAVDETKWNAVRMNGCIVLHTMDTL